MQWVSKADMKDKDVLLKKYALALEREVPGTIS